MPGKETLKQAPEEKTDFSKWAEKLAETLGREKQAENGSIFLKVLKWVDEPENAARTFSDDEKKEVNNFFESVKNSPGDKEKITQLAANPEIDREFKNLLEKILKHLEKSTTEKESYKEAIEGVPISAPPQLQESEEVKPEEGQMDAEQVREDEKPEEKESKMTDEEFKKMKQVEELRDFQKKVDNMSTGELFAEIGKRIMALADSAKQFFENLSGSLSQKKYAKEQIDKSELDFTRVEEKTEFKADNRDVEYVAKIWNIPVKKDAEDFRLSLQNTQDCIYETEKDLTKLKTGDILFFHDGENTEKAAITAIVSDVNPPQKMKLVHESENIQEVGIQQSPLFNRWLGYIRMPEKTSQPAELVKDKPQQTDSDKPASGQEQQIAKT